LVADVAVAIMLVGGFSALLTNANPLLPLDGYFALADYLELPNLRHRAAAHLTWWLRRHVLRMNLPDPDVGPREERIFLIYGALSTLYVGLFALWLGWLVLDRAYRALGVLAGTLVALAVLALARRKLITAWRGLVLAARARAGGSRWRRWRRHSSWVVLALLLAAGVTPWPLQTDGRFTVAPVRVLAVTAPDSAVVADIFPGEGERVSAGDPVVRLVDFSLIRSEIVEGRVADSLALLGQVARARSQPAAESPRSRTGSARRPFELGSVARSSPPIRSSSSVAGWAPVTPCS
jgi:putative peptide zinc metalloprotease protein